MAASPQDSKEAKARAIVSRLARAGYPAYFVGGAVRDRLMGRSASDIDIATSAPPSAVESLFEHTVPVGKAFGVVLVLIDKEAFEVATFRTEGPYEDGRRPAWIRAADARADAARRDFTLNGLLYDPLRDEVLDWVGGRRDIEQRLVRCIGEPRQRFQEDKLRLLRALRFASSLGFQIEETTARAIRELAPAIHIVSAERIRDELIKMFTSPHADRALHLLGHFGLLEPILPEVARMKGVQQGERYHPEGDVLAHTIKILAHLSEPTVSLAFSALLHDVGKPPTYHPEGHPLFPGHARIGAEMSRKILNRLRFDTRTRDRIVEAVANHLRFLDVERMRPATLRRFLLQENFDEQLELHRLDCLAGSGDLRHWTFCRQHLEQLRRQPLPPLPLLKGRDLLRLGLQPGPHLGRILRAVEEKRLEGSLASQEEAERWVKEHYDL